MTVKISDYNIDKTKIITLADQIIAKCNELLLEESLEAGHDFFSSVKDNCSSMKRLVIKIGVGTKNQLKALKNMDRGVASWEAKLP